MNVRLHMLFGPIQEGDWESLRTMANRLTIDRKSVRVSLGEKPNWLVVDFTMATQPQYAAVDTIDEALTFDYGNGLDTVICFPKTEAEAARAKRKNDKQKAKRRFKRGRHG